MDVVLASALALGDTVRLDAEEYGDAIVFRIDDAGVHVRRPYMHAADFAYTGGVIVYIGHEDIVLARDSSRAIKRVRKGAVLR